MMAPALNAPLAAAMHEKGFTTAALLTSDDAYGRDGAAAFTKSWTGLGGKIVAAETFPVSATDFTAQITKIRASNPQVLYIVAVGDTQGLLAKQARALGLKAQMVGPLATAGLIKVAGPAAEGFIDTGIAVDPDTKDPQAKAFLEAYKQKYGSYPEWDSGTAFEAVQLLADLIREVVAKGGDPRNGQALLDALNAHPSFHDYLAGGTVTLLPDHGAARAIAVQQIENGQFKTLSIVTPKS